MILPLTKNSAEMFRDYLKEETLEKKKSLKRQTRTKFPRSFIGIVVSQIS